MGKVRDRMSPSSGKMRKLDDSELDVAAAIEAIQAAIEGTQAVSGPLTDTQLRATAVPVVDDSIVILTADVTADDSDKSFTVTALKVWQPLSVQVSLVTTATVGNRQMTIDITDGSDNLLARVRAGAVQAASLTYTYTFGLGLDKDVAPIALHLTAPLPAMLLAAGYKIRVYDSAAVAAAADDMTVRIITAERAA